MEILHTAHSAEALCTANNLKDLIFLFPAAVQVIKSELRRFNGNESGGVLFGIKIGMVWLVMDICDSGDKSLHKSNRFIMDMEHAQRCADRICICPFVRVLGLWHSHNHSLSVDFSEEDISTNAKYASLNRFGAISILVSQHAETYTANAVHINRMGEYTDAIILGKYNNSI